MEDVTPQNTGKKILVVEDDVFLADVYVRRLQIEGFDARPIGNGNDALPATKEFKPDLILLDLMLPGMNGLEILSQLRQAPETQNVKVIVLTALSQDEDRERVMGLGANEFIVKSHVQFNDVVERIKYHLGI